MSLCAAACESGPGEAPPGPDAAVEATRDPGAESERCGRTLEAAPRLPTDETHELTGACVDYETGFYFAFDVDAGRWVAELDRFDRELALAVYVGGRELRYVAGQTGPLRIPFEVPGASTVHLYVGVGEGESPYAVTLHSGSACDALCDDEESYCSSEDVCRLYPRCDGDEVCAGLGPTPAYCTPVHGRHFPLCRDVPEVTCEGAEAGSPFVDAAELAFDGVAAVVEQCSPEDGADHLAFEVQSPDGEPASFAITTAPDDPASWSLHPYVVADDRRLVYRPTVSGGLGEAVHRVRHLPPGRYFVVLPYDDLDAPAPGADVLGQPYRITLGELVFGGCADDDACGGPVCPDGVCAGDPYCELSTGVCNPE